VADIVQKIYSLLEAPLPSMLERLGVAIAHAQMALDKNSMDIAVLMGDADKSGVEVGGKQYSLLELGFTPTFYAFTEATIDLHLAFTIIESTGFSVGGSIGVNVGFFAASVNASYTSKYQFDANGSSNIRAKLVSLPPPTRLAELLRAPKPETT
jgi:hypothetical protein